MKTLALIGVALGMNVNAQQIACSPRALDQAFPTMHHALSLEGSVKNMSMAAVSNMMCQHVPFARGYDVIVYLERDSATCYVTTVFSFVENKCVSLEVIMSYENDDDNKKCDIDGLVSKFNSMYDGDADVNSITAHYRTDSKEPLRCLMWTMAPVLLQMRFTEKEDRESVQLLMLYK